MDRISKVGAVKRPIDGESDRRLKASVSASSVWLDFIRGLAASIVFLGHARVLFIGSVLGAAGFAGAASVGRGGDKLTAQASAEFTDPGHIAVIVFFVLSGYLVGGGVIRALRSDRWSLKHYIIQRLSRLWTVLIPALMIGMALDAYGLTHFGHATIYGAPSAQRIVFPDLVSRVNLGTLLGDALFLQGIQGVKTLGTNSPLWTLSFEFWFYVAFPFLAFALWPATRAIHRVAAAIGLILIGIFVGPKISLYFVAWLMGAAIEVIPQKLNPRLAAVGAIIGSIAFVTLCIELLKAKFDIVVSDSIEALSFAFLCFLIVHIRKKLKPSIFSRTASGLSAISYTLYLVHAPILVFLAAVIFPIWHPWQINALNLVKFGCICTIVFIYAVTLWCIFERNTPKIRAVMNAATSWIL